MRAFNTNHRHISKPFTNFSFLVLTLYLATFTVQAYHHGHNYRQESIDDSRDWNIEKLRRPSFYYQDHHHHHHHHQEQQHRLQNTRRRTSSGNFYNIENDHDLDTWPGPGPGLAGQIHYGSHGDYDGQQNWPNSEYSQYTPVPSYYNHHHDHEPDPRTTYVESRLTYPSITASDDVLKEFGVNHREEEDTTWLSSSFLRPPPGPKRKNKNRDVISRNPFQNNHQKQNGNDNRNIYDYNYYDQNTYNIPSLLKSFQNFDPQDPNGHIQTTATSLKQGEPTQSHDNQNAPKGVKQDEGIDGPKLNKVLKEWAKGQKVWKNKNLLLIALPIDDVLPTTNGGQQEQETVEKINVKQNGNQDDDGGQTWKLSMSAPPSPSFSSSKPTGQPLPLVIINAGKILSGFN